MKIERDETFRDTLLEKIRVREFSERTGTHGSDLIFCLNKQALRHLKGDDHDDATLLLFSLGLSTQAWLTGKPSDAPSIEVDGISITPDEYLEDGTPWELKATYKSSRGEIDDSVHWIKQIMCQCYVTHTTTAKLSRLEIMGNWKFNKKGEKPNPENRRPTLSAYSLEFTQGELDRNWKWMLGRKELFEHILETGELLPKPVALASGMGFECDYCTFRDYCEEENARAV